MAQPLVMEGALFNIKQTSIPEGQLQEYPAYQAGRVVNLITPPVLGVVGITGNLMTLIVLTCSSLGSSSCWKYLAALALADMIVLMLNFSFGFVDVFLHELLTSDVVCKLYYFMFFTCVHFSAWLLVAVTTQRCLVICRPMTSFFVSSNRCTVYVIAGLIAASGILNMHHLIIRELVWSERTQSYVCHTRGTAREAFVQYVWPMVDATAYCFLPSPCLIVLNAIIIRTLRKAAVFRRRHQRHHQKKRGQSGSVFTVRDTVTSQSATCKAEVSVQISATPLFVSDATGTSSPRLHCSVVAPEQDRPASSAWISGSPEPVPKSGVTSVLEPGSTTSQFQNDNGGIATNEAEIREGVGIPTSAASTYFDVSETRETVRSVPPVSNMEISRTNPPAPSVTNMERFRTKRSTRLAEHTYTYPDSISVIQQSQPSCTSTNGDVHMTVNEHRVLPDNGAKTGQGDDDSDRRVSQPCEHERQCRQLTLMPLLASLVFVTLSAPIAVTLVLEQFLWNENTPEQVAVHTLIRMLANTLMYLNHSVNFMLYCLAGSTFRHHWCSIFCRARLCCGICPCRAKSRSLA